MTVTANGFFITTSLERKTGLSEDRVVNGWHYVAPSGQPAQADYDNWAINYGNFMAALAPYLSPAFSRIPGSVVQDFYKIPPEKALLGPPHHSQLGNLGGSTTGLAMPSEVALCLSLDGTTTQDPEHGAGGVRPASRKRNRVFLGPLNDDMNSTNPTTGESEPAAGTIDLINIAYAQHMVSAMINNGWIPMLFSKVAWALWPLLRAWIDNAWDSQRRRGTKPTVKYNTALPQATQAGFEALGLAVPVGLLVP